MTRWRPVRDVAEPFVYPWRNWHFGAGSWHWAECTTCGECITRWDGTDAPPPKHRALIDEHVRSHPPA